MVRITKLRLHTVIPLMLLAAGPLLILGATVLSPLALWKGVGLAVLLCLLPATFIVRATRQRRQRASASVISALVVSTAFFGLLWAVTTVVGDPDTFYLHDTNTTGITPAGKYKNDTLGSGAATLTFDTQYQNAYWYTDTTINTGLGAGAYTFNMYFDELPRPWWDANYSFRQPLNISAGASSIPSGYPVKLTFDHAQLVTDSKSQSDGDDIRIVYWTGSAWSEVDRALGSGSAWNSASTTILFKTQAAIAASGFDTDHYLFYNHSTAASPPTNTPSSRYYIAESLGETQTSSTTYASKVQLQFTPSDTSEHWVVVSTWRQRHVGGAGGTRDLGWSRISINGAVRTGTSQIGLEQSGNAWMARTALFKITGVSAQQTIDLEFRASGGTDAIDSARILAFLIPDPGNADIQYGENLARANDTVDPAYPLNVTFTPSSAGDYVWMANGFFHEGPGSSTGGGFEVQDETGTVRQTAEESYSSNTDEPFQNVAHFQTRTLTTSSQTFSLVHFPDTTPGSERQGLAQLLFRTDVFDLVESASSESLSTTSSTSYQTKNSLTTATVSSSQDFVYLLSMIIDHSGNNISNSAFGQMRLAGSQQIEAEQRIARGSYETPITWASAETVTGNRALDQRFRSSISSFTAHSQYAQILSLRYKEPALTLGGEEEDGVRITVSVHHTKADGTDAQEIVSNATVSITNTTSDPHAVSIGTGTQQTFSTSDPRRVRVRINVTDTNNERFVLAYDSAADPSNLNTPALLVSEVLLTNPTLNPTSGSPSTFFNFTIDYSNTLGMAASVVKANVSDATNNTYNNFTMSPVQTPEVDYFVQENWTINGTVTDFANMQADQGSSATLVQNVSDPVTQTILEASATADDTTPSTSYVLMDSMSLSPDAGDYLAVFSTSVRISSGNQFVRISLFVNGVQQAHTEREHYQEGSITNSAYPIATNAHITVGAGETVEVRWLVTGGTGTAHQRTLNLFPVDSADISQANATADDTLASGTYTLLDSMTLTPGAGDYLLLFSTSSDGPSPTEPAFAVFVNGAILQHTERTIEQETSIPNSEMPVFIAAHVSPGAGEAVEIRWARSAGSGTIVAHERTLNLVKTDAANIFEASATTDTSATNTADALLTGMTLTPGAGSYLALFSDSHRYGSIGLNIDTFYSIYVNGVQTSHTARRSTHDSSIDNADIVAMTNGVVSPGAGEAVEVQWHATATNSRTSHERTLVLLKVGTIPGDAAFLAQFNTTGIRSTGEDKLVIRYNLTTADDTFGVWVWNFTAGDWAQRGTLDQTAVSYLNYTLTSDEKSSGTVRIRLNDTLLSGSTNLTIDYQLVNNTLWKSGVTYYVNTTLAAGWYSHFFWANDTNGESNQTTTFAGPTVNAGPAISNFRLENATAISRVGDQLDVDVDYFFLFNVTDENGWGDIGDNGNVSLRLWYDGNQTPELTYDQQTTGANYRIELQYVDTADPSTASLSEWSVAEGRATYNESASSLTAITNGYEFKLAVRLGFQAKQANDPTNSSTGDYNDNNSWNAEVAANDGTATSTLQTVSSGEHLEFGVYMFTFVNISADWTVTLGPGDTQSTNTVTVYYRSNDDFKMTIWFTTHLVNASDTIDIANVQILAAADPNDNITSDFTFTGLGQANGTYIFGSATWWFLHNVSADENTVSVQFSVTVPFGTLNGDYTANLTIRIEQRPQS